MCVTSRLFEARPAYIWQFLRIKTSLTTTKFFLHDGNENLTETGIKFNRLLKYMVLTKANIFINQGGQVCPPQKIN
jgi:hypothetical protein